MNDQKHEEPLFCKFRFVGISIPPLCAFFKYAKAPLTTGPATRGAAVSVKVIAIRQVKKGSVAQCKEESAARFRGNFTDKQLHKAKHFFLCWQVRLPPKSELSRAKPVPGGARVEQRNAKRGGEICQH